MAKLLFLFVVLATVAYVSALGQFGSATVYQQNSPAAATDTADLEVSPIFSSLSNWLVDNITRIVSSLARHFSLKLRIVKFLVSLFTTENLVLLRNVLEQSQKLVSITLRVLPTSTESPGLWWVPAVATFLNATTGPGGNFFGIALNQPSAPDSDDLEAEATSAEMTEDDAVDPPIFFNAAAISTTEKTDTNEVSDTGNVYRDSRSAPKHQYYAHDDVLQSYQGRLMTLDSLINAKRK